MTDEERQADIGTMFRAFAASLRSPPERPDVDWLTQQARWAEVYGPWTLGQMAEAGVFLLDRLEAERSRTRAEDCAAVCFRCRDGLPFDPNDEGWHVEPMSSAFTRVRSECLAQPIRALDNGG